VDSLTSNRTTFPNWFNLEEYTMIEWFEDLSLGMRFKSETVQISEDDIKQFATKFDPQPFHLDDEVPKKQFSRV
jgi:acyl dehydratase